MDTTLIIFIIALLGLAIGFFIGRSAQGKNASKKVKEAEEQSKLIIKEAEVTAESIKKDKIHEGKEDLLKMKSEFEDEAARKKNIIINEKN